MHAPCRPRLTYFGRTSADGGALFRTPVNPRESSTRAFSILRNPSAKPAPAAFLQAFMTGTRFDIHSPMRRHWTRFMAVFLTASFAGFGHACCIRTLAKDVAVPAHKCCPVQQTPARAPSPCPLCKLPVNLATAPAPPTVDQARSLVLFDTMPAGSALSVVPSDLFKTVSANESSSIPPLLADLFHTHCLLTI